MNRLWRVYVLSNIHISLCAVVFCWAGYRLLDIPTNSWVLLFLFTGSLCTYTVHRIISSSRDSVLNYTFERFAFVRRIGKWKILYISILIAISLFAFSMLGQQLRLYLAILSTLSIGYIIPMLGSERRLRDISFLKIFLVAIVWAGIFITPISVMKEITWTSGVLVLFVEKLIFIFALTLPFDIRDQELDQSTGVVTFANVLTIKQIKTLIVVLLFLSCLLSIVLCYMGIYNSILMFSLLSFYIFQAILSLRVGSRTNEIYYLGILDGLIILHGLLIIILH